MPPRRSNWQELIGNRIFDRKNGIRLSRTQNSIGAACAKKAGPLSIRAATH